MANGKIDKSLTPNVTLWTGSFTSGSITVPNAAHYSIFEIVLEGGVPCFGTSTWGSGGYPEYASNTMVPCGYRLYSTVSGNSRIFSITSTDKGGTAKGNHVAIISIRGLL